MGLEAELDFERPLNELERKIDELRITQERNNVDLSSELAALERRTEELKRDIYSKLSPWQRVMIARHPKRPYTLDYIGMIFTNFTELHGDRAYSDDSALVAGLALLDETPVFIMGQQKGHDLRENIARNFGMMNPEGYRKALRLMKLAEKFKRPVITFIDTPGAYPGIGAEERGQAEAIAKNLAEMSFLKTPIVSIVIGEGGSGGALGIGVADRILMLENSVYSVITPEGCAAILWKSAKNAPDAAAALKMTSRDLLELGIIDEIVPEPPGGAHRDQAATAVHVKASLKNAVAPLMKLPVSTLIEKRLAKFRKMGRFTEGGK